MTVGVELGGWGRLCAAPPLRRATTIPGLEISGSIYIYATRPPTSPPSPRPPVGVRRVPMPRPASRRPRSTLRAPASRTLHPRQHRRRHDPGDTLNRGQPPTIEGEPLGSFLKGASPRTDTGKGGRPNASHAPSWGRDGQKCGHGLCQHSGAGFRGFRRYGENRFHSSGYCRSSVDIVWTYLARKGGNMGQKGTGRNIGTGKKKTPKTGKNALFSGVLSGGRYRTRICDLLHVKQAL